MKTRPKELTGLTLILLGIAASFPLQILVQFGDSPTDLGAIVSKLSPLNFAVIGLALLLAPCAHRASRAFWLVMPLLLGCVAWNNWLIATVFDESWSSPTYLSTAGLGAIMAGILMRPSCRMVLTNPRSRWWLTPERRKITLDARICPVLGGELASKTFDLSAGGAFINLEDARWRATSVPLSSAPATAHNRLAVGSYCWLRVTLPELSAFSCTAEIVRNAPARGNYPSGIGLRFVGLTTRERDILRSFLKNSQVAA